MSEVWANIPNNDDYQISNLGRVCSYKKNERKILKGWIQNTGYLTVSLGKKKYSVHRLVAEVFIHHKTGRTIVNHKDGNKLNNNVNNLEWCTTKENNRHAFKTGLMNNAIQLMKKRKIRAKRINQYDLDGNFIKSYLGSIEAETNLKKQGIAVNGRNIRNVCQGKRNTAGGFVWRYANDR